ncbi:MAG TPA: thioredoxin domain-containing protein [Bryocella sp.]|nr:thioredoxin domain-containing protein [Bryocella sp.]
MRSFGLRRLLAAALFGSFGLFVSAGFAAAQMSMPPNQVSHFTDTSMLKPPAGVKLAVIEWEDLECPACAHAFPFVHAAVGQYHIPLVEYDFLIPGHIWSHQAALYSRYMKDKISPQLAEDYRRQVFAAQYRIASQDDLLNFTKQFMGQHGKQMPFVVDPTGQLEREVEAEVDLGKKLGLVETPTIIIVTPHRWIQVKDVSQLDAAIDLAKTWVSEPAATVHHTAAHTAAHTR